MSETESIEQYLDDGRLTAAAWAEALRAGVLLGQTCTACGHMTAAPKAACARCGVRDLTVSRLPTEGEVYSETTIGVAPEGYEAPYKVALVTLGEARVLARVGADADIGDAVTLDGVFDDGDHPTPLFE